MEARYGGTLIEFNVVVTLRNILRGEIITQSSSRTVTLVFTLATPMDSLSLSGPHGRGSKSQHQHTKKAVKRPPSKSQQWSRIKQQVQNS